MTALTRCIILSFSAMAFNIGWAADIRTADRGISISGQIVSGDYKKFISLLRSGQKELLLFLSDGVFLNSPGGDVIESLRIANFIRVAFGNTTIPSNSVCMSSCFFIWASGTNRSILPTGRLGVHRISVNSRDFDVVKNEVLIGRYAKDINALLEDLGISRQIIDKMNETPATDIFIVSNRWLNEVGISESSMNYRPAFLEIAEKQCGIDPYRKWEKTSVRPQDEVLQRWQQCTDDAQIAIIKLRWRDIKKLMEAR